MATRYFCDGCDGEVSDNRSFVVNIQRIEPTAMGVSPCHSQLGKVYHLCERCEHQLKREADPTKWPRVSQAA